MADPNLGQNEDPGRQPPPNGAGPDDHDDESVDWKARARENERKLGQLINERKREKEDRKKLAETLKAWNSVAEEHNIEPDDLRQMLATRSEAELKSAREKGEIDKLLADQAKKFERQLAEKDQVIRSKETILESITIDQAIESELDKLKVIPALKKAAFMLHRPKARIIQDTDERHGIRVVMEVAGDEMTVADYLRNWAENDTDADAFLVGNESVGGGAPPGGRRGGTVRGKPRSKMTAAEKSQYIRAHGKVEYDKLPWT